MISNIFLIVQKTSENPRSYRLTCKNCEKFTKANYRLRNCRALLL